MIKKIVATTSLLLLIAGCSGVSTGIKEEDAFIKYDNIKHIVGNKDNSIKTLVYVENKNGKVDKKIIFYIDKFPYYTKLNLCSERENYRTIKSVQVDNKGNKTPIYENRTVDCNSQLYIDESLSGNYNLLFLDGFKIQQFQGFELLLPYSSNRLASQFDFAERHSSADYVKKVNQESYWYFE